MPVGKRAARPAGKDSLTQRVADELGDLPAGALKQQDQHSSDNRQNRRHRDHRPIPRRQQRRDGEHRKRQERHEQPRPG